MRKVRILVPPGIGDIYWVLTKLQGFLAEQYPGEPVRPELTVCCTPIENGGHLRAIPFLEMFPWLDISVEQFVPIDFTQQAIFTEAYSGPGRAIFPNFMGFDYFISYNGRINSGDWIENDYTPTNWFPEATFSFKESEFVKANPSPHPYGVAFFPFYGTYVTHEQQFPIAKIAEAMTQVMDTLQMPFIFIGSKWDRDINPRVHELISALPKGCAIDFIGIPSLNNTFDLLHAASIITGYHAGITNLAAAFGRKTVLLWDNRYPASTAYACIPPEYRMTSYLALPTWETTVKDYSTAMIYQIVKGTENEN